jgi:hypothetical protein
MDDQNNSSNNSDLSEDDAAKILGLSNSNQNTVNNNDDDAASEEPISPEKELQNSIDELNSDSDSIAVKVNTPSVAPEINTPTEENDTVELPENELSVEPTLPAEIEEIAEPVKTEEDYEVVTAEPDQQENEPAPTPEESEIADTDTKTEERKMPEFMSAGNDSQATEKSNSKSMSDISAPTMIKPAPLQQRSYDNNGKAVEPAVQEEAPLSNAPEKTIKKGKKGFVWLVVILAVLLLGAGGYYIYTQIAPKEVKKETTQEQATTKPTVKTFSVAQRIGQKVVSYSPKDKKLSDLFVLPSNPRLLGLNQISDTTYKAIYLDVAKDEIFTQKTGEQPVSVAAKEVCDESSSRVISDDSSKLVCIKNMVSATNKFDVVSIDLNTPGQPTVLAQYNTADDSTKTKDAFLMPAYYSVKDNYVIFQKYSCFGCDGPTLPILYKLDLKTKAFEQIYTKDNSSNNAWDVSQSHDGSKLYLINAGYDPNAIGVEIKNTSAEVVEFDIKTQKSKTIYSVNNQSATYRIVGVKEDGLFLYRTVSKKNPDTAALTTFVNTENSIIEITDGVKKDIKIKEIVGPIVSVSTTEDEYLVQYAKTQDNSPAADVMLSSFTLKGNETSTVDWKQLLTVKDANLSYYENAQGKYVTKSFLVK